MKFALISSAVLCSVFVSSCGDHQRERMDSGPRNTLEIPYGKSRHNKGPQEGPSDAIPADRKPEPSNSLRPARRAIDTLRAMTA